MSIVHDCLTNHEEEGNRQSNFNIVFQSKCFRIHDTIFLLVHRIPNPILASLAYVNLHFANNYICLKERLPDQLAQYIGHWTLEIERTGYSVSLHLHIKIMIL